jgi:hypothetical protein
MSQLTEAEIVQLADRHARAAGHEVAPYWVVAAIRDAIALERLKMAAHALEVLRAQPPDPPEPVVSNAELEQLIEARGIYVTTMVRDLMRDAMRLQRERLERGTR